MPFVKQVEALRSPLDDGVKLGVVLPQHDALKLRIDGAQVRPSDYHLITPLITI